MRNIYALDCLSVLFINTNYYFTVHPRTTHAIQIIHKTTVNLHMMVDMAVSKYLKIRPTINTTLHDLDTEIMVIKHSLTFNKIIIIYILFINSFY